jgi:hypothetical protein
MAVYVCMFVPLLRSSSCLLTILYAQGLNDSATFQGTKQLIHSLEASIQQPLSQHKENANTLSKCRSHSCQDRMACPRTSDFAVVSLQSSCFHMRFSLPFGYPKRTSAVSRSCTHKLSAGERFTNIRQAMKGHGSWP